MAITTRLLGVYAGNNGQSTVPVALTTGAAAGEYVTALVGYTYDSGWVATATGYPLIADGTGAKNTYSPYLLGFAAFASGGETQVTINKGSTAQKDFSVVVLGHTNVDPTTPAAAAPVLALGGRGSGTAPSISPSAEGTVLWVVAHQNYRAGADSNFTWSNSTEVGEALSTFNVLTVAAETVSTAATGTRSWSISPYGGNTDSVVAALALREAPAAPSGPEPGRFLLAV